MALMVLGAKAGLAVLLLTAGGAKLADLSGFAATMRLFVPDFATQPVLRAAALGIALGELAVGAASLSSPGLGWVNAAVLAICCGFLAVSAVGYAWHRDRPCRCFGAMSKRTFNAAGLGRSALLAACAGLAEMPVRPSLIQLGVAGRLALLAGAVLVAGAACTAAAAVAAGRDTVPGWA